MLGQKDKSQNGPSQNRQQQYNARHPAPDSGGHQFDKSFRCKYILAAITPRETRRSARLRITTADLEKYEPRKKGPELKSENRYQFVTKLNSLAASVKVPKRWEKGFLFSLLDRIIRSVVKFHVCAMDGGRANGHSKTPFS